jgi:peptidoglycan/LPS O-acetylase OafA/YrhL
MPEPVRSNRRYMPGLDGLRAVAVLAVIAYHLGLRWAPGGLLGVGVFFTLSGYLITDILLAQMARLGHIRLPAFWLGRARRLLPALFVMLFVVTAWVTVIGPAQPTQFREAVAAAALYVSNWQLILQNVSYFSLFAAPSPLNHLWSLAVEEQFYILWPFLLVLGVRLVREAGPVAFGRPRLAATTLGLALLSAILMAVLYHPSLDPSRVYYGTDTRACELLVGAALAMVWPSRRLRAGIAPGARRVLDGAGVAGLAVIGLMVWRTNEYQAFLYRGGFLLLAVATALVVGALAHPACRLGPILGWAPLRWIGVRSYGIYLWHFPIIVLTTPTGDHAPDPLRELLQVGAIFGVAALSWRFVEEPVRHGALGRLWAWWKANRRRPEAIPRLGWALLSATVVILAISAAGLAGVNTAPADQLSAGDTTLKVKATTAEPVNANPDAPPGGTSCRAVVHIGDSTSEGLNSTDYLPRASERIKAQYARVGATVQRYAISGALSIVETFEGNPNAYDVARSLREAGFDGCWVVALGTNDTADVVVGPGTGRRERIDRMMSAIGGQPVLWLTVRSLLPSGPYSEENMQLWNDALLSACFDYPNLRVYDWASAVKDDWFIDDGIHFTSIGYAARARLIAQALADAFPAGAEPSPGCIVH